ncbi:NKAP domain containing 1 isoform X3 [Sardina pilchardus]
MWKLRGREKHVPPSDHSSRKPPSTARGYMHCDRDEDDSSPSRDRGGVRDRLSERHERGRPLSDRDEREARYWTRKLYEFEANDPDRWGHSGFKELYPEEFKSDGRGESSGGDDNVRHKKKKCKSSREADHRKHSSKSSKKKKRKKEKKKQRRAETSDSDSGDSDGEARRKRRRREEEKRKVRRKERREDESSSEESESEGEGERERERRGGGGGGGRRKRHRHRRNSDSHQERPSKKRKNWKAADGEKTDESSDD